MLRVISTIGLVIGAFLVFRYLIEKMSSKEVRKVVFDTGSDCCLDAYKMFGVKTRCKRCGRFCKIALVKKTII